MGRGNKRRLSDDEKLQVTEFMEAKSDKKFEKKSVVVKGFSARTDKQAELVQLIEEKEIVIAVGLAGSGKSYCAIATALSLLPSGYEKIILVKSVITLPGEEIGFLKGNLLEKMEPFMMSYTWNIDKIAGYGSAKDFIDKGLVQVLPIAYIRGLSIDNSIIIVDEAQNLTSHKFKSIITRLGANSKYIFLGDIEQVDIKKKSESCLAEMIDIFKDSNFIGTVEFTDEDCVRNPLIPKILEKLRERNI